MTSPSKQRGMERPDQLCDLPTFLQVCKFVSHGEGFFAGRVLVILFFFPRGW